MEGGLLSEEAACPSCREENESLQRTNYAAGLALDEIDQLIYIADRSDSANRRIQVVSFEGKFLKRFGQYYSRNHGV